MYPQLKKAAKLSLLFGSVICRDMRLLGACSVCAGEVKRWIPCCLRGVDKHVDATDLVSPCLGEIIIIPGTAAEWCWKTGAQQMWGLVRNFICHCTLHQTSLLIRSPWIRQGIWTVCSWTDRMMSFCVIGTQTHTCDTHSSIFFQACLSIITRMAWMYLCYWEALGAITPSSGCFDLQENEHRGSALHTLHQQHDCSPPFELFVPHSCTSSLSAHLCLTMVIHHSLLCLTIHVCIYSTYLSKHMIESSVHSSCALIGMTSHKLQNQWSAEELSRLFNHLHSEQMQRKCSTLDPFILSSFNTKSWINQYFYMNNSSSYKVQCKQMFFYSAQQNFLASFC